MLDQFGEDSCLGAEKYFKDSIDNGVLFEFGNFKKPFGFLKEFLEEDFDFQVFAQPYTDKIRDCMKVLKSESKLQTVLKGKS